MSTPAMTALPSLLRVAFVRRPHGVRGEVRVEPLGGDAARFTPGLRLEVEATGCATCSAVVESARALADGDVLLRLGGVLDRTAAEALRDAYLCVPAEARRPLGDREWFLWELAGLRAVTPAGAIVGTVADVEHYTAHDVLVVRAEDGRILRLPMVEAFVRGVDVAGGTIAVTPWAEDAAP